MRYFLVSLLLNLALLFLPLNSRLIEDPKKDETMRIKCLRQRLQVLKYL